MDGVERGGSQPAVVNSEHEQEIHILDLLILLSKRRNFIFLFTAGVAVLSAITAFLLPIKYTAATLVLPPGQNSSSSSAILTQLAGSSALASAAGAGLGLKNPGEMYVSLLTCRTVEDSLVQRFDLVSRYKKKRQSEARKGLEQRSKVTLGAKDGLITISVTDSDPKFAADLANAYVEEFKKLSATLAITEASQRRKFFQDQLLEVNESLAKSEDALERTQQATGIVQVDSQARYLIESAATLRGQIAAKEVELQGMRSFATETNPQVVTAQQQLSELRAQLSQLSGKSKDPEADILVPRGNLTQAGLEYVRRLRDVKYYETVKELIARQFEMAKLDEAREGTGLQVADVAIPPDKRSFPKRTIIVMVSTIIALIVACGWCILADSLGRMVNEPAERDRLALLRSTFRRRQSQ
jgi:Uncharacterized protein involved in exopolysaccharide biosynthesis